MSKLQEMSTKSISYTSEAMILLNRYQAVNSPEDFSFLREPFRL